MFRWILFWTIQQLPYSWCALCAVLSISTISASNNTFPKWRDRDLSIIPTRFWYNRNVQLDAGCTDSQYIFIRFCTQRSLPLSCTSYLNFLAQKIGNRITLNTILVTEGALSSGSRPSEEAAPYPQIKCTVSIFRKQNLFLPFIHPPPGKQTKQSNSHYGLR